MEELKAKLEQLERDKEGLNSNNRDDQFAIRRIENEQEEIKAKLQSLEAVDNAKGSARTAVLERLGVEDEDLIRLNEIILEEVLSGINDTHAETISRLHREYQQKIDENESGAEEREAQLQRQNEELQKDNRDKDKLMVENGSLKDANATLSSELSEKTQKITELSHQINEMQLQVNDALSKRDAAVQEKERMEQELARKSEPKKIEVETDEAKQALVERINSKYRSKSPEEMVDAFEQRQLEKAANGGRAVIKAPPLGGGQANADTFRTEDNANAGDTEEVKSFRAENETKRVSEVQQGHEQEAQSGEGKADQVVGDEERFRALEERVARLEVWKDDLAG